MWVSTWSQGARAAAAMAPKVRLRLKCPAAAHRAAGDAAAAAPPAAAPAEGGATPAEGDAEPAEGAATDAAKRRRPSGPSGGSKASRERDAANARVAELLLQNQALAQELEAERKAAAAARLALEGARESHSADQRLWDAMAEANGIVLRRDAQGRHRWPADVRARAAAAPVRSPPPRRR